MTCSLRITLAQSLFLAAMLGPLLTSVAMGQPANDLCANATPVTPGAPIVSTVLNSTNDGTSSCSLSSLGDVYHLFTTSVAGVYTIDVCAVTSWDSVLSLHTGCPADTSTEVACDDDGCSPLIFGSPSKLRTYLPATTNYIIRVAGFNPGSTIGDYQLAITAPPLPTGACCLLNICAQQTQGQCSTVGGSFVGLSTTCSALASTSQTFTNVGAPAPIPDNNAFGVSRTITVSPSLSVGDVRVELDITHSFIGDLRATLSKGTTTVPLFVRVGAPTSPLGFDLDLAGVYTFSDSATRTLWDAGYTLPLGTSTIPPGAFRCSDSEAMPRSLRQAFDSVNSSGDWTLTIIDLGFGDTGVLNTWSLVLTPSIGPACAAMPTGACCTGVLQGGLGTTCTVLTAAACTSAAGIWRGPNVACGTPNNPVACCKVNFDQVNGSTLDDIFIFLNAWFARDLRTDFDGLNGINLDDVFIYINSWFAGCPS